jgi:hypothetical protein
VARAHTPAAPRQMASPPARQANARSAATPATPTARTGASTRTQTPKTVALVARHAPPAKFVKAEFAGWRAPPKPRPAAPRAWTPRAIHPTVALVAPCACRPRIRRPRARTASAVFSAKARTLSAVQAALIRRRTSTTAVPAPIPVQRWRAEQRPVAKVNAVWCAPPAAPRATVSAWTLSPTRTTAASAGTSAAARSSAHLASVYCDARTRRQARILLGVC